jgi:HSP20 family protein
MARHRNRDTQRSRRGSGLGDDDAMRGVRSRTEGTMTPRTGRPATTGRPMTTGRPAMTGRSTTTGRPMTGRPVSSGRSTGTSDVGSNWLTPRGNFLRPQVEGMQRFAREMSRMFEDWGINPSAWGGAFPSFGQWPPIEMLDRNGRLVVRAELPGLRREDVKVRVVRDTLVIEGERRQDRQQQKEGFYQSEWSYGRFIRRIPLPASVDPEMVTARFQDGVLEVALQVENRGRDVPIESGRETEGGRGART